MPDIMQASRTFRLGGPFWNVNVIDVTTANVKPDNSVTPGDAGGFIGNANQAKISVSETPDADIDRNANARNVTAQGASLIITSVVNGATFSITPGIASGCWITIFGSNLSTITRSWTASDFVNGVSPTFLSGVSVTIDGKHAFLSYISPTQLNVLVPDDPEIGTVTVRVSNELGASNDFLAEKAALSPGLFLFTFPPALEYPAAEHSDYSFAGPPNLIPDVNTTPAHPGDVILLYGTGFGATKPPTATGAVVTNAVPIDQSVTATIGGVPAKVAGYLIGPGLYQFNVTVPDLPDGDAALVITVGGKSTPSGVFLTVMRPSTGVSITVWPSTALVAAGQTRNFSSWANSGPNVPVSWAVDGVGSIDATGLYTAPASVASQTKATVTATSQAGPTVSASALVIVLPLGTALYGTALEPSLAIGGPSGSPTMVVTWYQDFAPFPGRNGALGLAAAISHDGQSWTESAVPIARCQNNGKYVPSNGLNYMMPANARSAVGPDGTIYVVSIAQLNMRNNLSLLAASMKSGTSTWNAVRIEDNSGPNQAFHSDEPSITADPNVPGTAYAVWEHTSGYPCSTTWSSQYCPSLIGELSVTRDYGRTWSVPQKLPVSGDWHNFAWPRLVVDPVNPRTLYVYFADWQTLGTAADIEFIRSNDGAQTWSQPVTVVPSAQAASTQFGLVVNPKNGIFYLAFVQPGPSYSLATMTSTDRGVSWSTASPIATNVGTTVSMAMTSDGTIAVMYDSFGLSAGYSVVKSVNGGHSWSKPVQVAAVNSSIAPNNFLGDYEFELADRGGVFAAAYVTTFPGVRPSAAVYYSDMAGTTTLLSTLDPFAGCTINPLP